MSIEAINIYHDVEYEKELVERFKARMPKKVFDAHLHLNVSERGEAIFDDWRSYMEQDLIGEGKASGALIMGATTVFPSKELFDEERLFNCTLAEKNKGSATALLVDTLDDPAEIEQWIKDHPTIVALKPYKCFSRAENTFEVDMLDFVPEWMWELADKYGISVLVHLSHYTDMLKDERNGKQIRYVCQKYPNAKMVLAHCALGHHPDKLKSGLKWLEGLDNVWMDCSGVTEALSILYSIQALGHKKILYGSDGYYFGKVLGRIFAMGGNFIGLHDGSEVKIPPDYQYRALTNACEGLLALFAAGDILGLTDEQWDDIFYNNADELYLSKIR